jgi:hypothetical protein
MTAFDTHAHVVVPELLRDADPGRGLRRVDVARGRHG